MQTEKLIIRNTTSVCPLCLKMIEAVVVERNGRVYMDKKCDEHGNFELILSNHPAYYKELSKFYFPLMDRNFPQRDYIVHLTNKCNLNCPICLAGANIRSDENYSLKDLKQFLRGKSNYKIDLMGAEPTMREDLLEIIRTIRKSGNIATLHTNGIAISNFDYLKQLKKAGLKEVHFQFDGFSDDVYEKIRGRPLLGIKLKVLENLEKLHLATDLKVTIVRGINEGQMLPILMYACSHDFVKEVFFLGCRFLGKAKNLPYNGCIMPDELIDSLEQQSGNRINRAKLFSFQKIYFSLLSAFSLKKCFYNQHFLIIRADKGFVTIDRFIDLTKAEKIADNFKQIRLKKKRLASLYLVVNIILLILHPRNWFLIRDFLMLGNLWIVGFVLSRIPRRMILLGFITACDSYSFDSQIAKNCGKGAISANLGIQPIGAVNNIANDAGVKKMDKVDEYISSC